MFSEWIADAASRFSRSLCGISFEYCGNPQAVDVRIDRDSIQKFFSSTSHCFSILTTRDEQFIVYKEESNGYFLIAGTEDFVNRAFRCAEETVIELFQWAVDNLDRNELYRIWNKYNEQKLEYTS